MAEPSPSMNWDLMNTYLTKNVEFKDESRQLISNALGFEPNLHVSIIPEIQLRSSIRDYQNGQLTKETLNKHLSNMTHFIRTVILKRHPQQAHLVKPDTA
jgi:hypothetical protein